MIIQFTSYQFIYPIELLRQTISSSSTTRMLVTLILCCFPGFSFGILSELHAVLRKNAFCGLHFDKEIFSSLIASNTRTHPDLIDEYINVPIRYYDNSQYSSEQNAYNKLKIIFHFMNYPDSPLCIKLTSYDGFLNSLFAGVSSENVSSLGIATRKLYYSIVKESAFITAVQDIFREKTMKNFVFPSEKALGNSWIQFGRAELIFKAISESQINTPSVYQFSDAFHKHIDLYVAFFVQFYQRIKPTDVEVFKTLVEFLGLHPLQSKLHIHLLFSKNPVSKLLYSLYFSVTSEATLEGKAERIVEFLLRKEVTKQILDFIDGIDSSDKFLELKLCNWIYLLDSAHINEAGIKSVILMNTLTRILHENRSHSDTEEVEQENSSSTASISFPHFVVALSAVEVYPKAIAKFISQVFPVKTQENQLKIFFEIVNILCPDFNDISISQLEDVYKINHYKAALFMVFKIFDFSDPLETAKLMLQKLESLTSADDGDTSKEDENELQIDSILLEESNEIIDEEFAKCQDYEDSYLEAEICLENAQELKTFLKGYIERKRRESLSLSCI